MENLIVINHCQAEHHINKMVGGWTDTNLTDLGRRQAKQIGEMLQKQTELESYTLISSDLLRAKQTADIIGDILKKPVTVSSAIREINLGSATGKTVQWLEEHAAPFPQNGRIDHRLLNDAESSREHYNRIARYLDSISAQQIQNAIIISHGGSTVHIVCWWLKIPIDIQDAFTMSGRSGGVTILSRDQICHLPHITCYNDGSYSVMNQ
jgi:broad specificity phosphatase PhoE